MLSKKTKRNISIAGFLFLLPFLLLIIAFAMLKLGNEKAPKTVSNPNEVSMYLTHKIGPDFFNGVSRGDKFTLRLSEVGINDILAHQNWPVAFDGLTIKWAKTRINTNGVEIISSIDIGNIATILRINLSAQIQDDTTLLIRLGKVRAGRLPAKFILKRVIKRYLANSDGKGTETMQEKLLKSLLLDESFAPKFEFMGSDVLITNIKASKGLLILEIQPTR